MNTPAMLSWLFWFSTTGGPPSDTMVLISAVCALAEPAPTQHKVKSAPQAAPEKCLMKCLAIEKDCDQGVCCKIVEPFRIPSCPTAAALFAPIWPIRLELKPPA